MSSSTRQRRSPAAVNTNTNEPTSPSNIAASVRSQSPGASLSGGRASGSSRSRSQAGSGRPSTSSGGTSSSLSLIEKGVTRLLVATKRLLEILTKWSHNQATDSQVSDVYVRLGYEFNMACRAFNAINVSTTDLGNVPQELRNVLEATLSQEASPESLDRYLPRIRDIIIKLLQGLRHKQQSLRQRHRGDRDSGGSGGAATGGAGPERITSVSTTASGASGVSAASGASGLTNMIEDGLENGYSDVRRGDSQASSYRHNSTRERHARSSAISDIDSNGTVQHAPPPMPPYPESGAPSGDFALDSFPPPPLPPPKETQTPADALAKLQKEGVLERRASRRYSQYQISKVLNSQAVPMMPQNATNLPGRPNNKDKQEAMLAVQTRRDSVISRHSRAASNLSRSGAADGSPAPVRAPDRQLQESESVTELPSQLDESNWPKPRMNKEMPPVPEEDANSPTRSGMAKKPRTPEKKSIPSSPPPSEPQTPKDLTLFLQYKSKIKKFVLPEGRKELSIGRLQLAFIEKFSWNTHHNGVDLPEIYIQDPVSGVRHELEDLSDISDRTVLVLNVEALDEVRRHIDEGLGGIRKLVEQMKENVDVQGAAIVRVSEKQQETAKEIARIASAPPQTVIQQGPPIVGSSPRSAAPAGPRLGSGDISEIKVLRRDLAVLRQTYSSFQADIESSMSNLRAKAANIKTAVVKTIIPDIDGDAGYSYVANGRKKLNSDSDRLVGQVDDLQDLVEDLRKDVVHRGVRPLPRQLETVTKDIALLTKELSQMDEYLKNERPLWTKIWEKELEDVCQGRDELRLMEDLLVDLKDDLQKASETFALVEQATKEQMKDNGTGASAGSARSFSKGLNNLGNSLDQNAAKDGVLGEVRALQPNHEDRLEAIERAQKLRQKELATRMTNDLQKEISSFVDSGKLKKSGGFEEVERARRAAEEKVRRDIWGTSAGGVVEDGDLDGDEQYAGDVTITPTYDADADLDDDDMGDFVILADGTVVPASAA
ncbi:Bud site selection protein 6 [Ceratocystis lukuohia]|uniref:Bud site selection protein 6 n=1 Tax=Ceratocystis lukuohia TaxID=2019550 RepID=A0ABR4MSP5_9PEZI